MTGGAQRRYVDNNTATYYRQHGGRYRGPEGQWRGKGYNGPHH